MNEDTNDKQKQKQNHSLFTFSFFSIFILLWLIIGTIAFIYSLFCLTRKGTTTSKIIGLLLAWFLGPFFFIYLKFNKSYCVKETY